MKSDFKVLLLFWLSGVFGICLHAALSGAPAKLAPKPAEAPACVCRCESAPCLPMEKP